MVILYFLVKENSLIRELLEKKYTHFIKNDCIISIMNEQNADEVEAKLIVYLSIAKEVLKMNDSEARKDCFLQFSESFIHQVCAFVVQMDEDLLAMAKSSYQEQ